jgi:uncharacterized protein YgbK (DUF1537 family)
VPAEPLTTPFGALVVALKIRSIPAAETAGQSLAALIGCAASTADRSCSKSALPSTRPPAGNIDPVAAVLAECLGARGVPVCPAFPGAGRTVY